VGKDHQLLKTARDYSQFVTTFFEAIDLSATHIYHSALELSPLSSIVRKVYYHQRPHPSPRVIVGIKDSWGPTATTPTKHLYYLSSTWSPCGQLVAVAAGGVIEIWDALTLKLFSTLHSNKSGTEFLHGLAYSPDGYSLACCSNTGIIIWDVQTGGEVTRIGYKVTKNGFNLAWSLDGKTICIVSLQVWDIITVTTYDVTSGAEISTGTLQSTFRPNLWAHEKSFQLATVQGYKNYTIDILEVGSTPTKVESFPIYSDYSFEVFSPTTY